MSGGGGGGGLSSLGPMGPAGEAVFGGGDSAMDYAQRGAEEQAQYVQMANKATKEQYELGLEQLEPWRAAGTERALPALESAVLGRDFTGFRESPGYQFSFDEMMRGVQQSAAAMGGLLSSGTQRNLQRGAQGLASTEFQNYLGNVGTLTGYGYGASGQGAQMRGQLGNVLSSNYTGLAPAMAAPYQQQANIQQQQQAQNQQMLTQGGMMAAMMMSDGDLKENIEVIGTSPRGFEIVEFCYLGQPERRYKGVIAQQVEEIEPDAVHVGEDGYKMVDYSMLDVKFEEVPCH